MRIGTLEIGPSHPCAVICEISGNHNQDFDRALALIKAAKDNGASAVKFQCYTLDEILRLRLRGDGPAPEPWAKYTKRQLYEKNQTPLEWFPKLFAYARELGIPAFSTVMGKDSLALLESLGCPAYKLAAAEMGVRWLRELVQGTGKPLIRSSHHSHSPPHAAPDLTLYCPPGYPVVGDFQLGNLRHGYDGLSFHSLNEYAASVAAAVGAKLIEVHLMLDLEPCLDQSFSYLPAELARLVQSVRETEEILG